MVLKKVSRQGEEQEQGRRGASPVRRPSVARVCIRPSLPLRGMLHAAPTLPSRSNERVAALAPSLAPPASSARTLRTRLGVGKGRR